MNIKTIIRTVIQLLLKTLPLKNRIVVSSYWETQKSDSPWLIYKYIKTKYPKTEIIFLWNKQKNKIHRVKVMFYKATSKVVVDNMFASSVLGVYGESNRRIQRIRSFLSRKRGQKYVTTWHGTPLKRMGRDMVGSPITDCIINQPLYLIMGNTYTADILNHMVFEKVQQVRLFGSPRNDSLVNFKREDVVKKKQSLELPQDKKIALFAPTFRSDSDLIEKYMEPSGIEQLNIINFDKLFYVLEERFGGEWVLICRFHYFVANMVDWKKLKEEYPNRFINGNLHEDIADYLLCSDILITDYSSCMFDYAVLNRPVFLFCHDLKHYQNEERGFYIDINELPFPLAESFDGLYNNIRNFNNKVYCESLKKMKEKMGYCEEGDATEKAGDFIYGLLKHD